MIDAVKAELFYGSDAEKIKMNWFCYEYANLLFEKIEESRKLARYRQYHSRKEIAELCAHFSLSMKKSIDDRLRKITDATIIDDEYVYDFNPGMSEANATAIVMAACDAWEEMLPACECCPNRCISERYERTDMFDRL